MLVDTGYDLQVKVTDLEISYKSKKKLHLSLYSYTIRTFVEFYYPPTERFRGYSYQHGIHPSCHLQSQSYIF